MSIYKGTTKIFNNIKGTTPIKVFKGSSPVFSQMTVNFDEQGGSAVSNKLVYFGEQYGTLPDSTKAYYEFTGWQTAISGGSTVHENDIVNEALDHTLYARWAAQPVLNTGDITYEENSQSTLVYYVENTNPFPVTCYYEHTSSPPDANSVVIEAYGATFITFTGLSAGTGYNVYFIFVADGNLSAVVNKYNTTQSAGGTNWVLSGASLSPTTYAYDTTVTKSTLVGQSCFTSAELDTWLTGANPPGNYAVGHVIRVYHRRLITKPSTYADCGYYWFTNQ